MSGRGGQDRRAGADNARTLLLLTFHVTYWNYLGWQDPYSFDAATHAGPARLCHCTRREPLEVYTPAFIVDGKLDAVGSDAAAVDHTLRQEALFQETAAQIDVQRTPAGLAISRRRWHWQRHTAPYRLRSSASDPYRSGENSGRTLEEANIVRSMSVLGGWSGKAIHLQVPYPGGQEVAVILQRNDGPIVGAGVAHAASSSS